MSCSLKRLVLPFPFKGNAHPLNFLAGLGRCTNSLGRSPCEYRENAHSYGLVQLHSVESLDGPSRRRSSMMALSM